MNDKRDDVVPQGPQLCDELKQFATDLTRLRPRDDRLDRERLAYLAGQASVAARSVRSAKLLGVPLESLAWPAAFAAMTAVAAALFITVMMRPQTPTGRPAVAEGRVQRDIFHLAIKTLDDSVVLSVRDVRLGDIEARLREREREQDDAGTSSVPLDDRKGPVLTPNAWHQVINETKSPQPSQRDATGIFQDQRGNS